MKKRGDSRVKNLSMKLDRASQENLKAQDQLS